MKTIITLLLVPFFSLGQSQQIQIKLDETSSLELRKNSFNAADHRLEYDGSDLIAVDGISLIGTDGEKPISKLIKATLIIGDKKYDLQVDNMYDPWMGETINEKQFSIKHYNANQHRVQGLFSFGKASYGAEWMIMGGSSLRTIFSNDFSLLSQHFRN